MTDDEIKELSAIESRDDCCVFCSTRCAECGSVDIGVQYERIYKLTANQMIFEMSYSNVACNNCNPNYEIKKEVPESLKSSILDFSQITLVKREYVSNPKLAKQFDKLFANYNAIDLSITKKKPGKGFKYFIDVYEYENSDRNSITLNPGESFFIDNADSVVFDDLAGSLRGQIKISSMEFLCKNNLDESEEHFVIEARRCVSRMATEEEKLAL